MCALWLLCELPAARAQAPDAATLLAHRGAVRIAADGADARAAADAEGLRRGDSLRTGEDGAATLKLREGFALTLEADSALTLEGAGPRRTLQRLVRVSLERGALHVDAADAGGAVTLVVATPTAELRVQGRARIAIDEQQRTRAANLAGPVLRLQARRGGRARGLPTRLRAGTSSAVSAGGRPSRPRALPAAPSWRTAAAASAGGLRARWSSVRGAVAYRLALRRSPPPSADNAANAAAQSLTASFTVADSELRRPAWPSGHYWVQVRALGAGGFAGEPSPWHALEVAPRAAPLSVLLAATPAPAPAPAGARVAAAEESAADEAAAQSGDADRDAAAEPVAEPAEVVVVAEADADAALAARRPGRRGIVRHGRFRLGAFASTTRRRGGHELGENPSNTAGVGDTSGFGVRASIAAARFLHVEAELSAEPVTLQTADMPQGDIFGYGLHAHASLPRLGRLGLFAVAGGAAYSLRSDAPELRDDIDLGAYYGAGARLWLGEALAVRIDARHLLTAGYGDRVAHGFTWTLGLSWEPLPVRPELAAAAEAAEATEIANELAAR
ncbi:FecR domain-containing protein [Haliangium ochraceum]|uniref:FecR domain-containing protein n=1 Tax=Haliangium ochraceum TaxID=80816 RepID=UPI00019BAB65|nr:FecR domain-containing protein [Haliangium ochraceum]